MNLPNKITISRIFLIPVFMVLIYIPNVYTKWIALAVFIIASVTDSVDGHIARSRNMVTNFGKFLDPLADKLLVTAALIALVGQDKLPSWLVTVIIAREFIVTGIRLLAVTEGRVIAASMCGKIKTVTQIIAISLLLLDTTVLVPLETDIFMVDKVRMLVEGFALNPVMNSIGILAVVMAYVAVGTTIYSGYEYIVKNVDVLKMKDC